MNKTPNQPTASDSDLSMLAGSILRLAIYAFACVMCLGNAVLGFAITIQGGDGWPQLHSALCGVLMLWMIFEYQSNLKSTRKF